MPSWSVVIIGSALVACSATEGALLVRVSPDAGEPRRIAAVQPNMLLHYQISSAVDTQAQADVFVSDLFETTARQVSQLHDAGRLAIAYVSVGSLENWRPDRTEVPSSVVGMPLEGYTRESWLDHRRDEVRTLMRARFKLASDKGFDGVFASTLGAYRKPSGFVLTQEDELRYATFLAEAAHAHNLDIGLSGDFELSELVEHYDWAITFACVGRSTCGQLAPFVAANLAVFDLEPEPDGDRAAVCAAAAAHTIPVTFRPRDSEVYGEACR